MHDGVIALQCVGFIGASRVIFQEAFHSHGPGGSFGLGLKDGAVLSHEFIPGKRLGNENVREGPAFRTELNPLIKEGRVQAEIRFPFLSDRNEPEAAQYNEGLLVGVRQRFCSASGPVPAFKHGFGNRFHAAPDF